MLTASPQPIHLSIPRVQILYLQPVVIETTGYEVASDPFADPPGPGQVVVVRLPRGAIEQLAEIGEDGGYYGVDGQGILGEVVSYRWPDASELADWNDAKKKRDGECAACRGTGFVHCYGDSGTWCVESCDEDAEGAERCPCDGTFDRWVA